MSIGYGNAFAELAVDRSISQDEVGANPQRVGFAPLIAGVSHFGGSTDVFNKSPHSEIFVTRRTVGRFNRESADSNLTEPLISDRFFHPDSLQVSDSTD